MATSTAPKTPAQRKAIAAKVAKDRDAKMTGAQLREKYGTWLTGPERRKLLREFGHDSLIAASYDRAEAKAKREALLAKMEADKAAKAKPAAKRASKPRAKRPAAKPAQPVSEAADSTDAVS